MQINKRILLFQAIFWPYCLIMFIIPCIKVTESVIVRIRNCKQKMQEVRKLTFRCRRTQRLYVEETMFRENSIEQFFSKFCHLLSKAKQ